MTSQVFDIRFALCSLIISLILTGCSLYESLDESTSLDGETTEDFRETLNVEIQKR